MTYFNSNNRQPNNNSVRKLLSYEEKQCQFCNGKRVIKVGQRYKREGRVQFYDTGIRNAIINDFNFLDSRKDTGFLWENFVIAERMKFRYYNKIDAEQYFWRTYDGNEIDLIEEKSGKLNGYEFKWNPKRGVKKQEFDWLDSFNLITKKDLNFFIF